MGRPQKAMVQEIIELNGRSYDINKCSKRFRNAVYALFDAEAAQRKALQRVIKLALKNYKIGASENCSVR